MTDAITIEVIGDALAQPRAKARRVLVGNSQDFVRVYTPNTATVWRDAVKMAAVNLRPDAPLTGPLRVDIAWRFRRPKAHFGSGRNVGRLKSDAPRWNTRGRGKAGGGGDLDNLAKLIFDALVELGFMQDDGQISECSLRKTWCSSGELPGATIVLQPLRDEAAMLAIAQTE